MNKNIVNYCKKLQNKIIETPEFLEIDNNLIKESLNNVSDKTMYNKAKYIIFESYPTKKNKSYGKHFEESIYLAFNSLLAFFIFCIHAFFPIVFEKKGTEVLKYTIDFSEKVNQKNE